MFAEYKPLWYHLGQVKGQISQELEEGLMVEEYSKEWSERMKALRKEAADLGKRIEELCEELHDEDEEDEDED